MRFGRSLAAFAAACALVWSSGCCGSSSEEPPSPVTATNAPVAAQPGVPGVSAANASAQPPMPAPGPATGQPRTLLLGSWNGQAHGETARQIQILRIAMQDNEPTAEQLASFTPEERSEITSSRAEMQGDGPEGQLGRALVGALVEVMQNVRVNATQTHLTVSHGMGDSEDQPRPYTVSSEQGNMMVALVQPPPGEGGGNETFTFTFQADGSSIMDITNEQGEHSFFRLTRGPTATP